MRTTIALLLAVALMAGANGCSPKPSVTRGPNDPEPTNEVVVQTTMGEFTIELYGKDAPLAVANFVGLAKKGYYEGILVHRVAKGFVIQAGDPFTKDPSKMDQWGSGGESIYGGTFADELNPATPSYKLGYTEGVVAMANRGPNTNTSQFFVIVGLGNTGLPHAYTIFGKVIKGMEVVHAIEQTPLSDESPMGGRPTTPVVIKKMTVN